MLTSPLSTTQRAGMRLTMQAGQTLPSNITIASASYELLCKPAELLDRIVSTEHFWLWPQSWECVQCYRLRAYSLYNIILATACSSMYVEIGSIVFLEPLFPPGPNQIAQSAKLISTAAKISLQGRQSDNVRAGKGRFTVEINKVMCGSI